MSKDNPFEGMLSTKTKDTVARDASSAAQRYKDVLDQRVKKPKDNSKPKKEEEQQETY